MTRLFTLIIISITLSACAAGQRQSIRVESPYAQAQISVNGRIIGRTPLNIPYADIHESVLNVTAVAVGDDAYRQVLTFNIPPAPQKIVVLAFHKAGPPAGDAGTTAARDLSSDRPAVKEKGCDPSPMITPTLYFDTDKSDIQPEGLDALKTFAGKMVNNDCAMEIAGFADERHTVAYNLTLSLRRARSVFQALHDFGIAKERMRLEGRGEIQTLDASGQKKAWRQNRKVEIRIVR